MLKLFLMSPKRFLWFVTGLSVATVVGGIVLLGFGFYFAAGILFGSTIAERIGLTYLLSKQLSAIPSANDLNAMMNDAVAMLKDSGIDLTMLMGGKK